MNNLSGPERIVTIAVDVQKDFIAGGSLAVTDGESVVSPLNDVMRYTRERGGIVVATRDWHPASTPHFEKWPVHCVNDTTGAEFHPLLMLEDEDIIISKGMGQTDGYSGVEGFSPDGQTIESLITPRGNERVGVLIGGLATDYCVLNTVLDTLAIANRVNTRGQGSVRVAIIRDAMRAVNLQMEDESRALKAMQDAKAIALTSAQILDGAFERSL